MKGWRTRFGASSAAQGGSDGPGLENWIEPWPVGFVLEGPEKGITNLC